HARHRAFATVPLRVGERHAGGASRPFEGQTAPRGPAHTWPGGVHPAKEDPSWRALGDRRASDPAHDDEQQEVEVPSPPQPQLPRRGAVMDRLEQSLNLAWVLVAAFLVMFMQAGFAMVETGFTRSRNAVHTMAMNFIIYPIGVLGFWITGFAFMWGGVTGWP